MRRTTAALLIAGALAGPATAEGIVLDYEMRAMGFAVALRDGEHLLGSLSVVLPATSITDIQRKKALARLQSAAGRIEGRLQDQREKARAARKTENP